MRRKEESHRKQDGKKRWMSTSNSSHLQMRTTIYRTETNFIQSSSLVEFTWILDGSTNHWALCSDGPGYGPWPWPWPETWPGRELWREPWPLLFAKGAGTATGAATKTGIGTGTGTGAGTDADADAAAIGSDLNAETGNTSGIKMESFCTEILEEGPRSNMLFLLKFTIVEIRINVLSKDK